MKNLINIFLLISFFSYNINLRKETNNKTKDSISDSLEYDMSKSIYNCSEDSLVKIILKNGKKGLRIRKIIPKPNVIFSSDYSEDFSFTHYSFSYKESDIKFIDTLYDNNRGKIDKRSTYLDNVRLNVCTLNNNKLVVDSIEMQIIYTESEIYSFDNNSSYLLVVSKPMNWVGRMTNFSFYQLISLKEKMVIEFISE